jgi:hypothetical protein
MTNPDFAELKRALIKFDDSDMKLIRLIKADNQAWADYRLLTDEQKDEAAFSILRIAEYQHTKSSAIISELIDIIKSQSEALELYEELIWNIHPEQESERYAARTCLSETNTRLQKLKGEL